MSWLQEVADARIVDFCLLPMTIPNVVTLVGFFSSERRVLAVLASTFPYRGARLDGSLTWFWLVGRYLRRA